MRCLQKSPKTGSSPVSFMQMSSRLQLIFKETTPPLAKEQRHMAKYVQLLSSKQMLPPGRLISNSLSNALYCKSQASFSACSCYGLWDVTDSLAASEAVPSPLLMPWVRDNSGSSKLHSLRYPYHYVQTPPQSACGSRPDL